MQDKTKPQSRTWTRRHTKLAIGATVALLLSACASRPPRLDQHAQRLGFTRQSLIGLNFQHRAYANHGSGDGDSLHVYLDGDGTPWLNRTAIAADPTPDNPLMLELMALDTAPSLYLGRPCYHGFYAAPGCTPLLWTSRRYAPEVVASMAAVLRNRLRQTPYNALILIGYSGGGTLAMLLAERLEMTRAVITLAGNLDPARWAAWHGYSPLRGSLNPATRPPLPASILQLHLAGGRDNNVRAAFIRPVVAKQHCAELKLIEAFDHRCCWKALWPAVLENLKSRLDKLTAKRCQVAK